MRLDEVEGFLGELNTRLLCAETNATKAVEASARLHNRLLDVEQSKDRIDKLERWTMERTEALHRRLEKLETLPADVYGRLKALEARIDKITATVCELARTEALRSVQSQPVEPACDTKHGQTPYPVVQASKALLDAIDTLWKSGIQLTVLGVEPAATIVDAVKKLKELLP
jgi:small-conductance mechanosensitive channel